MNDTFPFRISLRRHISTAIFAIAVLMPCLVLNSFGQSEDEDKSAEAIALFQKGQDVHEKGQLAEAIDLYDKAIAIFPEFPEAELQRGNALVSLGRIDDAEKSFRRAVELRGDWTLALANLGSILVGKGQNAEAEKILQKAISLDEQNFPAYSALTELLLKTKAKPEILRELLARIAALTGKAKPTASIWAARGALESSLGEKKAARVSFEKALELEPKNQFALFEKAGAALDEGDTASAEATITTLEVIAPKSVNVKVLNARLLFVRGKADDALAALSSIVNPSPDVVAIRDKILASSSQSVAELEKHLEKNASDPFILGRLCSALRTGNPAKALDLCRRASEADPQNISHAIGYGGALVQAKMFVEAVDLLRRLQTISPDNVTIRANLATALFQLKRYPEAKLEYQWITEKQPTLPAAFYFLAITHDHLTEYLDAMANYQQFLRIADADKNKLEIDKVNLRLPGLHKQIKDKKGKRT